MLQPVIANNQKVWIGCSGYVYKHWRGPFYPTDLSQKHWLDFYAQHFPTVELNNTFYMLPTEQTFENWRMKAPDGFLYAVKANRFVTHMKKLKEPDEHLKKMFERVFLLGEKLGPVLYQLPPRWRFNAQRLEEFLRALPQGIDQAIEVRETSWLNEEFFALLERFRVAYCIASLPQYQTPIRATASFVYLRFHGSGEMYYYNYTPDELRYWRDVILRFTSEGRAVYAYFNNDPNAWAVYNALELIGLLTA